MLLHVLDYGREKAKEEEINRINILAKYYTKIERSNK